MANFYRILGINHKRYVGICKADGKAYDFYLANIGGYRPPENEDEINDCQQVAMWYQADCDKYGTGKIQEDLMTPVPEEDLYNVVYAELE